MNSIFTAIAGYRLSGKRLLPTGATIPFVMLLFWMASCASMGSSATSIDAAAEKSLSKFKTEIHSGDSFLAEIPGYLVFPNVVKMGVGFGGETGEGVLRVGGDSVAYYRMSSGSVGLQLGIQSKSMIIAFRTTEALNQFRHSNGWQAGVDGSIAVLNVSANPDLMSGGPVAGIVFDAKGLMYNLTLEGTKFTRLNR